MASSSGTGHDAAETIRCGGCGSQQTMETMYAHTLTCDGWVSYEGDELAELAIEAGFGVVMEEPSWFARVILRRRPVYVIR